jgi:hypothetical protein
MRHVADIHIVSVKLRYLCFSQCIGNMVISWYLENSLFDQHLPTLHFPYLVSDTLHFPYLVSDNLLLSF